MAFAPENATVWAEIAVSDLDRSIQFYNEVFDYELSATDGGPNQIAMFPNNKASGICGHLYPGKPAADGRGPTVHLAVPDTVEAAMERCKDAGGAVVSDIVDIPPGRFAYILDLDGNSLGLFEPKK